MFLEQSVAGTSQFIPHYRTFRYLFGDGETKTTRPQRSRLRGGRAAFILYGNKSQGKKAVFKRFVPV